MHKEDTYEQLLAARDELIEEIREYEKREQTEDSAHMSPSPEVRYQCHLQYLARLCEYIAERYRTGAACSEAEEENCEAEILDEAREYR